MQLVALMGKRSSGKTTAAQGLERLGWRHVNFADPVRAVVHRAYGLSYDEMNDAVLKERVLKRYPFKSPRFLMQKVGTDLFRDGIDQATWTEAFKRATVGYSHIVCSDLRFPNEADVIRELGGLIIRVDNPLLDHNDDAAQHASETELDKITPDFRVVNDPSRNTVEELRVKILEIAGV